MPTWQLNILVVVRLLKGGDLGWYKEGELPSLFINIVPKLKNR